MDLVLLTEELVKALAINKEMVNVKEFPSDDEDTILIQVMVDSEDVGRVIGKAGKNANAIRLYEKVGFKQEGHFVDELFCSRTAEFIDRVRYSYISVSTEELSTK